MKFTHCDKCNTDISNNNIKRHSESCTGTPPPKFQKGGVTHCKYCNTSLEGVKISLRANHMRWCTSNPLSDNYRSDMSRITTGRLVNLSNEQRANIATAISQAHKDGRYTYDHLNFKGKHHSNITKQKLSDIKKHYLRDNPDKHPWRRNNKFISSPCEALKTILRNNEIMFEAEYRPCLPERFFSLDIAFVDAKIAIEVNGNQHYSDVGNRVLAPYYQTRHDIITNKGWNIVELHYSLVYDNNTITELLKFIKSKL